MVVPLLATYRSAEPPARRPPQPVTAKSWSLAVRAAPASPIAPSASIITRVSSLSSAPVSVERPSANACADQGAIGNAFRAGRSATAWIGARAGCISM